MTEEVYVPELFEIYVHKGTTYEDLPEPVVPYYVLANEGMYVYRSTRIGNVLTRDYKTPPTLGKIAYPQGVFVWKGEPIPASIISQATDFFRKVYDKHGTEAEVIITMHNDTDDFRLFIPYQRTNGAGVKSIFEPTHIDRNYTVVGTLHSHCHFSAFHSGTDSGDARDMDGVHFTIGMLQNDPPQIVAMVAMNGKEFHYRDPSDIAELDYKADTAPDWWMNFIYPATVESEKPAALKSLTQEQWNEFRGMTKATPTGYNGGTYRGPQSSDYAGWERTGNGEYVRNQLAQRNHLEQTYPNRPTQYVNGNQHLSKREERKQRKAAKRNGQEDLQIGDAVFSPGKDGIYRPTTFRPQMTEEDTLIDLAIDEAIKADLISHADWIEFDKTQLADLEFWQLHFVDKFVALAEILDTLGLNVTYKTEPKPEEKPKKTPKQVKGQTTMPEFGLIEGAVKLIPATTDGTPPIPNVTIVKPSKPQAKER